MSRKKLFLALLFSAALSLLLIWLLSPGIINISQVFRSQTHGLRVRNLTTGLNYTAIQGAIDASETLSGHKILVSPGVYYENVSVDKALSLVGEDPSTTIVDGGGTGIVVNVTSDSVELHNLTIRNGVYGVRLSGSRNSRLNGNNVCDNQQLGVELDDSGNCTLRNNSLVGNGYNFGVDGDSLSDFVSDIDVSNTVNGKPVYYLINQRNLTIDSSTFQEIGYLGFVNSSDVSVRDLSLTGNREGILLAYTTNSTINNVKATKNWCGIHVTYSANVIVNGSEANNNFFFGIRCFHSENSTVARNNAYNNGGGGISIVQSRNSTIIENNAGNNMFDIHIVYTNNSVISRNNAEAGREGYSVAFYYSNSNVVYHNNFANSLFYETFKTKNTWDNGFEGNHWRSYNGTDKNQDSVGDTPYVIGEDNEDNFPLMGAIRDFDVTSNGKLYKVTAVSNSSVTQFEFNPVSGTINLSVVGEGGTTGFCRVTIPEAVVPSSGDGGFVVRVNGRSPTLQKNWTDGTRTYLYFTYSHEAAAVPGFLIVLGFVFLIVVVSIVFVFAVLRKRSGGMVRRRKGALTVDREIEACAFSSVIENMRTLRLRSRLFR